MKLSQEDAKETAVKFWNFYRKHVAKELNKKRNACQDMCKKVYYGRLSDVVYVCLVQGGVYCYNV